MAAGIGGVRNGFWIDLELRGRVPVEMAVGQQKVCVAGEQSSLKYYLQYQMASKEGKGVETMSTRSTRRSKAPQSPLHKATPAQLSPLEPTSLEHYNPTDEHKDDEIIPKNEKDSTAAQNNQPPGPALPDEPNRRITRSAMLISKKNPADSDPRQDPLTPQDNPISKLQEEPTCRKIVKLASALSISEPPSCDLIATAKKTLPRSNQGTSSLPSPYSEIRKSYRKIHRREIISIPYRKCHDAFEGRIVTIINKIENGKNCLRDFESLIERMQRINAKDMINRFIIAGIRTVIRLGRQKDIYDSRLIERLEVEEARLRERILDQLHRTDDFEQCQFDRSEELIDAYEFKRKLIRKVYRLARRRGGLDSARQTKEGVLRDCEQYFNSEANVGALIRFVKQRMQLEGVMELEIDIPEEKE